MEAADEKQKRKVHRSPSYPAFDLAGAIEKARKIYENERRSPTTPEVLAGHMGYSAAVGPGGRAVSALRQYGLIEEVGGKYRLSDIGYTLVHFDKESSDWMAAVKAAVTGPTLFSELLAQYPDGLPSDATLRNDLLKREFNPSSIQDVVSIFRDTMSLVSDLEIIHNDDAAEGNARPVKTSSDGSGERAKNKMDATTRQDVFSLAEGEVTIQWPAALSPESFQDLGDWLDILKRKIGRSVVKPEGSTE